MAKQKQEKRQVKSEVTSLAPKLIIKQEYYGYIILAFSFLLYFDSIFNDYNMDDELVTQNHRLTSKGISAIPEIFSSPYYEDKAGYKYEYRPVVLTTFAIEHSIFGEHAWISHLINVLLYSLLCLILFQVLRELLQSYSIVFPFLITLFFAAYPLHTEVVASIKNRDEILALLFGLLSLRFCMLFNSRKNVVFLLIACLFFLFGILSKTTTITFVLLIPLSLILLSEISFGYLMAITIALAIPAVFFARLYSVPQQVGLFVLLLVAAVSLYCFKYFARFFAGIKKFISENFSWREVKEPALQVEHSLDFGFLKHRLVLASFVVLVSIAVVISSTGAFYEISWMAGIPLLGLALLFIVVREELKLLLVVPVTVIAILSILKLHSFATAVESALLVFIGGVILYRNETFKIVGFSMLVLYALVSVFANHSFYFLAVLLFVVMLDRRTYWLSYAGALISSIFYIKFLITYSAVYKHFDVSLLSMPVLVLGVVFAWRKRNNWMLYSAVLLIPVFVSIYSHSTVDTFSILQKSYYDINEVRATDLTPVQTVRPFNYIEIPISNTDPLTLKLGTAMLVLGKYLKLLLLPYPMSFYYGYSYISPVSITDGVPLLSLVLYFSLVLVALFFFRKSPLVSFSILFYLISISVFSNLLLQVPGMMGDRFLFIPSLGFCLLLVFVLSKVFKQSLGKGAEWSVFSKPLKISLSVILLMYSLITFSRNADWKNRITLFRHDINAVENSAQAQNLLALHLMLESNKEVDMVKQKQMREEALVHFKRAVEIYPNFLNATFDRARLLELLQRYDEALTAYTETTQMDSTFTTPYFAMGIIYQNKGNEEKAAECYEKYLAKHPLQMEVYANLSYSYFKQNLFDRSIATNQRALAVSPGAYDPYINIGKTYIQLNQKDSAIYYLEKAQMVRPNANLSSMINQLKQGK